MRRLLLPVVLIATAGTVAACGGSDDSRDTASTAATTTAAGVAITEYRVPTEVACTAPDARVAVTWATADADRVTFAVDGREESGEGAATGQATVDVPCDDARHEVTITATGASGSVSESAEVGTVKRPVVRPRPSITGMSVPAALTCTGDATAVTVTWTTRNANAVAIEVDGRGADAGADLPVSGQASVPVPCDDQVHRITLIADGAGTAAATHSADVRTVPDDPPAGPVITALEAPAEVSCTGNQASVPVSWETRDAEAVDLAVDGRPVPADAGQPVSGGTDLPVPCTNADHRITLTATGSGGAEATHAVTVHTVPANAPASRPAIVRLTMPTQVGCPAGASTAQVRVAYRTRNAEAVQFLLDGRPVPAQAGLPVNGAGSPAVPCDGDRHLFTLVAESTGNSEARVRRPITAVPTGGGTTTSTPTETTPTDTAPVTATAP